MKRFHVSDVLSITTGRLVSSRHMDGIYEILNFLTGDNLFTHQLPRAIRECEPWMRSQFPFLCPGNPAIDRWSADLTVRIKAAGENRPAIDAAVARSIEILRREAIAPEVLPEMLSVYELGPGMHTQIDPIEEAQAIFGDEKVIVVDPQKR